MSCHTFHNNEKEESTNDLIVVPVLNEAQKWGSVNIEFKSIYSKEWTSYLFDSILGVLLFVAVSGFVGYMFILRKALSILDPKSVVPDRVRSAFNALSEGVLIIDNKEQILMANDAFAKKINHDTGSLLGVKASAIKWQHTKNEHSKMPWVVAIEDGKVISDVVLNLSIPDVGVRSFSCNSTPIRDDNGDIQGALITINDITDIQESNLLLKNAVSAVNVLKARR